MPGVLETITFLVISAQAGALGAGLAAVGGLFSFTGLAGIGLSIGGTYLSSLVFKAQQPRAEDVQTSIKNSIAWRQRLYGRGKLSGPWNFADSYQGSFYKVIALCTGRLDAIEEYWCDDTLVGVDGNGDATTYPYKPPGYPPFLRILTRLGLPTETHYSELEDIFPEWDEDHRGDGVASLFATQRPVNSEFISFQFPQLTQTNYRVVARGAIIFNPINGLTQWTDNASAVIRDYMTHQDGARLPTSLFTTPQATAGWLAAANRAAELVDLKAGGTEARYRLWGTYNFNERPADVLRRMLDSSDSRIIPTADGGVTLDIGTWGEPTVVIDQEMIGDFEFKRGRDIRTTANTISATFTSPNHDYQTPDADRWIDEDDVSLRGEIVLDTSFNMSPSHAQCRRLMKLAAYRAKPNWIGTVQCNLAGLAAFGERFIRLTYAPFGIDEVVEVKDFRFNISDGGILTSVTIEFQSMPEEAYEWDPDTEEGTEPINEAIDIDRTIPVPTNFAGTIVVTTTGSGTTRYALLTFDNSGTDSLNPYLEGRAVGETSWRAIPVALDATSATSFPLDDLVEYEFRIRNVSATGRTSEWSGTLTLPTIPGLDFSLTGNSQYLPAI